MTILKKKAEIENDLTYLREDFQPRSNLAPFMSN